MTLPKDRGLLCLIHSREGDKQQELEREEEEGRMTRGRNKKLQKLQECDTDDCITVPKYVTIYYNDYILF